MYENLWMKRVLVPIWVVQLAFTILVLAATSLGLGLYSEREDDYDTSYDGPNDEPNDVDYDDQASVNSAVRISAGIYIAFTALTILFDIAEIVLFARRRLSPVVAVVLNSITTLIWLVIFILVIVALVRARGGGFAFILVIIILATCKAKLIYVAIILSRWRRGIRSRGAYTPAQAEAHTFETTNTAYNATNPGPFRRDPSLPLPQNQGAAGEYYAPNPYNAAPQQYEMQQQPVEQHGAGRYS